MKISQILVVVAGAALMTGLAGCAQPTEEAKKETVSYVGTVTTPLFDLSSTSVQAGWASGYSGTPTFPLENGGTSIKLTFSAWDQLKSPVFSTAFSAGSSTKFSFAVKGTWVDGGSMSFNNGATVDDDGFRISLYDTNNVQATFDTDVTATALSSTDYKAFSSDISAAGIDSSEATGGATTFTWTSISKAIIYSMGGNGTLTVSNIGFN